MRCPRYATAPPRARAAPDPAPQLARPSYSNPCPALPPIFRWTSASLPGRPRASSRSRRDRAHAARYVVVVVVVVVSLSLCACSVWPSSASGHVVSLFCRQTAAEKRRCANATVVKKAARVRKHGATPTQTDSARGVCGRGGGLTAERGAGPHGAASGAAAHTRRGGASTRRRGAAQSESLVRVPVRRRHGTPPRSARLADSHTRAVGRARRDAS